MIGRYFYRRLDKDEISTGSIKKITPYVSGNKEVLNHIICSGKSNVKKKYDVISLTSSLKDVCKGNWYGGPEAGYGPEVAIIKRECLDEDALIDVSTIFNFHKLKDWVVPSSMPQELNYPRFESNSVNSKEYCYVSNIPEDGYIIVNKEQLEKILAISKEMKKPEEWISDNFGKLHLLVKIHPIVCEEENALFNAIGDGCYNEKARVYEGSFKKIRNFYWNLVLSYLEDNYRDLDELVEKNGFIIPDGSREPLQVIIDGCESSEVMNIRRIQDELIENLFENKKMGSDLYPYLRSHPTEISDYKKEVQSQVLVPHKWSEGCESRCGECHECNLTFCKVCGSFEGGLTTHCPGEKVPDSLSERVYKGEIDFRAGKWREKITTRVMAIDPQKSLKEENEYLRQLTIEGAEQKYIDDAREHIEYWQRIITTKQSKK